MMSDDRLVKLLRKAVRANARKPPKQRFREMVERGLIDEQGNVLVERPHRPDKTSIQPNGEENRISS